MKLKDWRTANRYSQSGFADYLWPFIVAQYESAGLPVPEKLVTGSHVQAWENGSIPRDRLYRRALEKATNSKVKPASFLE